MARVTSGHAALDYAGLLRPDVVLVAPVLEDTAGVLTALNITRELPGIAAVVLTCHPAAADPAARPNWGAVALVPADAEPADLDAELRGAVSRARALAESSEAAAVPQAADAPDALDELPDYVPQAAADYESSPAAALYVADVPAEAEPLADAQVAQVDESRDEPPVPTPGTELEIPEGVATSVLNEAGTSAFSGEDEVIRAATDALIARTGFSPAEALRLMEQEAADLNQSIEAVARAVLGVDALDPVEGEIPAAA